MGFLVSFGCGDTLLRISKWDKLHSCAAGIHDSRLMETVTVWIGGRVESSGLFLELHIS